LEKSKSRVKKMKRIQREKQEKKKNAEKTNQKKTAWKKENEDKKKRSCPDAACSPVTFLSYF